MAELRAAFKQAPEIFPKVACRVQANRMDIPTEEPQPEWKTLQRQVAIHTETLRKLKMVKMYRTKNNLSNLEVLIEKWRSACQTALIDLHQKMPEPRPMMGKLITDWKIDPDLLNFDPDEDSFT